MLSTTHKIVIVAGCLAILLFGLLLGTTGWYNDAVSLEETVKAQYNDNRNQYDNFWKKVKEVAQVPEQYKEDFKDLLVSETEAKYGKEGSQASFQWLQDRNINFSEKMYLNVQSVIESGRNDFKQGQTALLDKQRKYSVHLKTFFARMLAGWYDMPHVLSGELAPVKDLDGDGKLTALDYPIVTSARTNAAFKAGEDNETVNVFGK